MGFIYAGLYYFLRLFRTKRRRIYAAQPFVNSILSGFEVFGSIGGDRTGTVVFLTEVEILPPEICLLTIGVTWTLFNVDRKFQNYQNLMSSFGEGRCGWTDKRSL